MSTNRTISYLSILAAIVIIAARALMPGAPWLMTICGAGAILALQQHFYGRSRYSTPVGRIILLAITTLLIVGMIANVYYFTTVCGGTDSSPVLINNDARRYFNEALFYSGLGGEPFNVQGGRLGWFYSLIFYCFGPSITLLSLICVALMAATLPVVASLTMCLVNNRRTATLAMLAAASVCYFLASGCIIIKDVWIIFGTVLCARAVVSPGSISLKWLLFGIVPLFIVRPNYLIFVILGIIIMFSTGIRSKKACVKSLSGAIVCAACLLVSTLAKSTIPATDFAAVAPSIDFTYAESNQMAYYNIIGDTSEATFLQRLILMPIGAVVQFLIPFPWNWLRDMPFGISYVYAHIAYPWYIFGGIVIYYLFTARNFKNKRLLWFTIWGLICWWAPCYFTMGTVSRYGLPSVSILAPCVAAVIDTSIKRRGFVAWMGIYCTAMAIVLIVCHHLQTASMS